MDTSKAPPPQYVDPSDPSKDLFPNPLEEQEQGKGGDGGGTGPAGSDMETSAEAAAKGKQCCACTEENPDLRWKGVRGSPIVTEMGHPEYVWGERGDKEALNPVGRKNQPRWPCCKCPTPEEQHSSLAKGQVPPALERAAAESMQAVEKTKQAAHSALKEIEKVVQPDEAAEKQQAQATAEQPPDEAAREAETIKENEQVLQAAQADAPVLPPDTTEESVDASIEQAVDEAVKGVPSPSPSRDPAASSASPSSSPEALAKKQPASVSASPLPQRLQDVVKQAEAVAEGKPLRVSPVAPVDPTLSKEADPDPETVSPWREIKALAGAEEMRERIVAAGALLDENVASGSTMKKAVLKRKRQRRAQLAQFRKALWTADSMVQAKEADAQRAVERVRRQHMLALRAGRTAQAVPESSFLMPPNGVVASDPRGQEPADVAGISQGGAVRSSRQAPVVLPPLIGVGPGALSFDNAIELVSPSGIGRSSTGNELLSSSAAVAASRVAPDVGSPAHIVCWSLAVEDAKLHGREPPRYSAPLAELVRASKLCQMMWTQAAASTRRDIRAALRVLTRPPAQSVCAQVGPIRCRETIAQAQARGDSDVQGAMRSLLLSTLGSDPAFARRRALVHRAAEARRQWMVAIEQSQAAADGASSGYGAIRSSLRDISNISSDLGVHRSRSAIDQLEVAVRAADAAMVPEAEATALIGTYLD